jgi:DNA-binding FadR family transcriptional regulator
LLICLLSDWNQFETNLLDLIYIGNYKVVRESSALNGHALHSLAATARACGTMRTSRMSETSDGNMRDRAQAAMREIRRYIESGISKQSFKPGEKLPTEREIADQFGTGRNTVRKMLEILEKEGTIVREIGRGTFVKDVLTPGAAVKAAVSGLSAGLDGIDIAQTASPRDLMEFRLSLEPFIAELSVERANGADIAQMQKAIDQSRVARSLQQFEDCDDLLHHTIAISTRNPLFAAFAAIVTRIRHQGDWGALKKRTLTDKMREVHTVEHVRIVDAIRRRNAPGARDAMKAHLMSVQTMMFREERLPRN